MQSLGSDLTTVIGFCGDLLELLTQFPLNILVVGLVASVGFRIIRGAKRVAR